MNEWLTMNFSLGLSFYEYIGWSNSYLIYLFLTVSIDLFISLNNRNCKNKLNQIDVVKIDPASGQMELLQNIPFAGLTAYGKGPRTLTIDPDEKYVFASAEGDHALLRFTIKEDGLLEEEYVSIPFEGNPGDIAFISLVNF